MLPPASWSESLTAVAAKSEFGVPIFGWLLKLSRLRKDHWAKKTWEEASASYRRLRV